jgi:hypothetical protein
METYKTICLECDWKGTDADLLIAPSPFDPEDTLSGCPKCKSVDCFRVACDFTGCWKEATAGTPTKAGYRHTCYLHRPEENR